MVKKLSALLCALICTVFLCCPAFAEEGYTYSVILADMEGLLSVNQQEKAVEVMQSTAAKIECNIGVVITSRLEGKDSAEYTYDFLKTYFGAGSSSIVLLMCEDHVHVDWIELDGRAADNSKYNTDRMFDALYDGFDKAGYYAGIESFCRYLEKLGSSNSSSGGGAHFNAIDMIDLLQTLMVPVIIALIIALIVTFSFMSGYSKKAPISARRYMDDSRTNFLRREDVFIREFTTSHRVSSSSSHGGGGHRGGGGRSRGGHRGGGGRRR